MTGPAGHSLMAPGVAKISTPPTNTPVGVTEAAQLLLGVVIVSVHIAKGNRRAFTIGTGWPRAGSVGNVVCQRPYFSIVEHNILSGVQAPLN
ncbi:MAG: hypothetical protein R2788_27020 [Saprospiraceae bacterium]